MKRLFVAMSVALLAVACSKTAESPVVDAGGASAKIFDMPYLMRDLDNGLRVIVVPTDYPDIVTISG
jgi:zinc protease